MARNKNDEMFAFVRERMEAALAASKRRIAKEEQYKAQDLFYEAMERGDFQLIIDALEIDPCNSDCLMQLTAAIDVDDPAGLPFARLVVTLAEKRLGKQLFEECKGHFWGIHETRPYMRARSDVARRLVRLGKIGEAIREHEGLLELCPGDNLGIRYGLVGLYLQEKRLDDARRLLEEHKDERDYSAAMAWGHVLERFLSGALDEAARGLAAARKQNNHVEAYLAGSRKRPKEPVGSYSPGSSEEAQLCAELQHAAWDASPEAVAWLKEQRKPRK